MIKLKYGLKKPLCSINSNNSLTSKTYSPKEAFINKDAKAKRNLNIFLGPENSLILFKKFVKIPGKNKSACLNDQKNVKVSKTRA